MRGHARRLPADGRVRCRCAAAVYNVPLGGAIFVLEVLLGTFELRALVVAVATSAIAAAVAWIGLGNEHQYTVPPFVLSTPLVAWSIVCGPLFGFAAYGFVRLTHVPGRTRRKTGGCRCSH